MHENNLRDTYDGDVALIAAHSAEPDEAKIFSAKGRIGRMRYWLYSCLVMVIMYVALGITMAGLVSDSGKIESTGGIFSLGFAGAAAYFAIVCAAIAASFIYAVRRLHDLGQSGWLSLLTLIPGVNILFSLYMLVTPGTPHANKFGNPTEPNTTEGKLGFWLSIAVCTFLLVTTMALPMA